MYVEPHHTPEELDALIRREPNARVARRLLAVRLARLGERPEDIGPRVLLCARQVRFWVGRYNGGNLDGLSDRPGRGRTGPLDDAQAKGLAVRLRAGPTTADGVCTLRGEDVRRILREELGVARSLSAVYDLMHRIGFEPLRPRPRHPSADDAAQAAFKKACPAASPRLRRPAPARPSRAGSRARPASARRAH